MALLQSLVAAQAGEEAGSPSAILDGMNAQIAGVASNVRVDQAELFVHGASWDGSVTTIFAGDRQHRLNRQFVDFDPRRGGFSDISYFVDQSDGLVIERIPPHRRFPWTANAANALSIHIDTVATHEAGHAFLWPASAFTEATVDRRSLGGGG